MCKWELPNILIMKDFDLRKYLAENKLLKEFTDMDFSSDKILSQIKSPDMFGREAFTELFPMGMESEEAAIRALKNYDLISQQPPMFVHMQVDYFKDGYDNYRVHQTQYYNSNFQDARNPRVTALALTKLADGNNPDEKIGTVLVKTGEYVKDISNLNTTKRAS